jgi:hypothetical protein
MLLRSLFCRKVSLFPPCYPYRSIPLLRPLVCSRSIPPIYFLRFIRSVSSPLHFPPCLWIFFSHPPLLFPVSFSSFSYSPVEVPSEEYTISRVFFHCGFDTSFCCLHLFTVCKLSLFSTIYCLYELFFPCILFLLSFLVAFIYSPQFPPVIIPLVAVPFFFSFFCPFVLFR